MVNHPLYGTEKIKIMVIFLRFTCIIIEILLSLHCQITKEYEI